MTAIISGSQLGLLNSSLFNLGTQNGDPTIGQSGAQSHVNAASGNLVLQHQDLIQVGLGTDINLLRTYNSLGRYQQNDGFKYNWEKRIEGTQNDRNVVVYHGDGSYSVFRKSHEDSQGKHFVSTDGEGAHETLTYANRRWIMTDGDSQTQYVFGNQSASNRKVVQVIDNEGSKTNINYTNWGDIQSIENSAGQRVEFDYQGNGNSRMLANVKAYSNGILTSATHYEYDDLKRLTKVIVDLDTTDARIDDDGDGILNDQKDNIYVTEYTYYQPNEKIGGVRVHQHDDLIKSMTQSDGTVLSIHYVASDDGWRVKSTQIGVGADKQVMRFDYHERRTDVTQVLDQNYVAASDNLLVSQANLGRGITTSYIYDDKSRLYRVITPADENGQRLVTSYHYDEDDNVVSVTDGRNQTTYMTYDQHGNVLSKMDASGNTQTFAYDQYNQLIRSTVYRNADPDGLGPLTASEANTTRLVYDEKHRVRFSMDAVGRITETRYFDDAVTPGIQSDFIYTLNHYDVSALDENADLTLAELEQWVANLSGFSGVQRVDRYFDFRDQVSQIISFSETDDITGQGQGDATVQRFIYDDKGQLLKSFNLINTVDWNDDNLRAPIEAGAWPTALSFQETSYNYDGMGRLIATTDAEQNSTQYFYGVGEELQRGTIAVTQANGLRILSVVNSAGEVIQRLEQVAANDSFNTLSETRYFYDALGRQIGVLDPTGVLTQTLFDDVGRAVATIDGTGALTENKFNENDLLVEQISYANFLSAQQLEALLIKDNNGNIVGLNHPDKVANNADLLAQVRPDINGEEDRHQFYFYDKSNQLTYHVDPEGGITKNLFDGTGQLISEIQFADPRGVDAVREILNPQLVLDGSSEVISLVDGTDSSVVDTALLSDGRYVSVWQQAGKIYAQMFTADGNKQGEAILVRDDDNGWEPTNNPVVTGLKDGGFAVFWEGIDSYDWDPKPKLEWQRFYEDGTRKQQRQFLSGFPYYEEGRLPAVTTLEDGSVVVVQQLYRRQSNFDRFGWDVHAVRLDWDSETNELGTISPNLTYGIVSFDEGHETKVDVAALDNGGFVMTWQATDGDQTGIKGKRFYKDGIDNEIYTNDDFFINQNTLGIQSDASIIQLKGGEFFSVWQSINESGESVIKARRYGADRFEIFNEFTIATDEGLSQALNQESLPRVTELDDGSLIITWQSVVDGNATIRVQHLDANGIKRHDSFTINDSDTTLADITIESLFGNRAVINWTSVDQNGVQVTKQQLLGLPKDPSIADSWINSDNRIIQYLYDDSGRQVGMVDQEHYLTALNLDAAGQVIEQREYATRVDSAHFDKGLLTTTNVGDLLPAQDQLDRITRHYYNQSGQLIATVDPEYFITTMTYDGRGNEVLSKRFYDTVAEQLNEDAWRQLDVQQWINETDATKFKRQQSYFNGLNQLKWSLDDFGLRVDNTYDQVGQLIKSVAYDSGLSESERQERAATFEYDVQGRLKSEQNSLAYVANEFVRYEYDEAGRMVSSIDTNNNVTTYLYNENSEITHAINGAGEVIQTVYNAFGEVQELKQYSQRLTVTERALISGGLTTDIEVNVINSLNDAQTTIQRSDYDRRGMLTNKVDGENFERDFAYNVFGELIRVGQQVQSQSNERAWVEYSYDKLGQLKSQAEFLDPKSLEFADALNGSSKLEQYRYDAFGQRTQLIDANQVVHKTVYDRLGREVSSLVNERTVSSTEYDAFNRQLKLTDARGFSTSFSHDRDTNSYTLLTPEGLTLVYEKNAFGETVKVTDSNQKVTEYDYDLNGNQIAIRKEGVEIAASRFDSSGLKLSSTDANGNPVVFEYDAANRLAKQILDPEVDPTTGNVNANALNLITTYEYDGKSQLLEVVDPKGNRVTNQYNLRGELVQIVQDPDNLRITTRYSYDGTGNKLDIFTGKLSSDLSGFVASTHKTQVFDAAGQLKEVITHLKDGSQQVSQFELDSNGNVTRVFDANQNESIFVYDKENRMVYSIDPMGALTENKFDENDNVIETIRYENLIDRSSISGKPTIKKVEALIVPGSNDAHQRSVFDSDGRVVYVADPMGAVTFYEYDGNNNVVKTIRYANTISSNQNPSEVVPDSNNDRVTQTYYDKFNRVTYTRDATGAVVGFEYDNNGNITKSTAYDQLLSSDEPIENVIAQPQLDQVTRSEFDAANRLIYLVDGEGGVTQFEYDEMGNQTKKIAYANKINIDQNPEDVIPDSTRDQVTRSVFDESNRLTYMSDPRGAVTSYEYDDNGNIISSTQYANRISNNTDPRNVITNPEQDRTVRAVYDAANRAILTVDALGGVVKNEYDAQGNLTEKRWFAERLASGQDINTLIEDDANDQVIRAEFDAANRMIYSIDGEGAVIKFDYDARSNLIQKTAFYDRINLSENGEDAVANSQFDQVTRAQFNQGDQMVYSVDGVGAVVQFDYDAFGKTSSKIEFANKISLTAEPSSVQVNSQYDRFTQYEYDRVGRQTKTIYPPVGIYSQENASELMNNGRNSLASRTESQMTLSTEAFYDAFGNIVANRSTDGTLRYQTYDTNNNIIQIVDSEGYVTQYDRDVFGNSTSMTRYSNKINSSTVASWSPGNVTIDSVNSALQTSNTDRTLYMSYNLNNQVIEVIEPTTYIYNGVQGGYSEGKTKHHYNAFGQLVKSELKQNANEWATIHHFYNRLGQETATVDARGYLTEMVFDVFGNVKRTTEYSKAVSQVSTSGYVASSFSSGEADIIGHNRIKDFGYDKNNRKVRETRVNVEYSVLSNGTKARGDLTSTFDYDSFGNVVLINDSNNNQTYTYYDRANRTTAVAGPARNVFQVGNVHSLTEFNRDAFGNVTDQSIYANGATSVNLQGYSAQPNAGADRVTSIKYDRWGRSIEVTDPRSSKSFMSYNANGQLAKQWTGVAGNDGLTKTVFSVYEYDHLGQVTKVISPTSKQDGLVVNLMEYNGFGEMVSRGIEGIDNGKSETFEYDSAGRLWRTNQTGVSVVMLYDLQGNKTSEIHTASSSLSIVSNAESASLNATRRMNNQYDGSGNIVKQTSVDGGVVNQTFDRWGNRLSFSDPRNAGWITQFTFNENNQVTSEVKPEITVQTKLNNQVTETNIRPTTYYYYDYSGNQVATRNSRNFVNGSTYDADGNTLTETHADGGVIAHSYNIFGDRVKTVDAENNTIRFEYDRNGNMTRIIKPTVTFGYYDSNNSLHKSTFTPTMSMTYDSLGRRLSESMNDGTNKSIQYTYDVRGNVVEYNKYGRITRSEFNKQDKKIKETNALNHYMTWSYDYFGRLQSKRDLAGQIYSFSYYGDGQLNVESNTRGRHVKHYYNQAGQLVRVDDKISSSSSRKTEYSYDLGGRRLTEKTTIDNVVYQDQSMEYDELGRLKQVTTSGNKTVNYEYDAADNRVRMSENVGGALRNSYFAYDSMNRQILVDGANNNNASDLTNLTDDRGARVFYDKNGNRTFEYSGNNGRNKTQQIYDGENRLVQMKKWDASSSTYTFMNERVYDKRSRMLYLTGAFKNLAYDVHDNLTKQQLYKEDDASKIEATLTNEYDALNNLKKSTRSGEVTLTNTYQYAAYDSQYKQTEFRSVRSDNTGQRGKTTFGYDVNGYLKSLTDQRNGDNNREFFNDNSGIALKKKPASGSNGEVYNLIVNDRVIGTWGNDFDPDKPNQDISLTTVEGDTLLAIANANNPKTWAELYAGHQQLLTTIEILDDEGNGTDTYKTLADLDSSERASAALQSGQIIVLKNMPAYANLRDFVDYQKIDKAHPGSTLGQHVVKAGETLRSIAQATYGSAQLWYVIANANGLTNENDVTVGNTITLPSVINGEVNNARSFQPYDPSLITGDTSPHVPPPEQNDNGCAKIAIIIVAVIAAVAITVLTAGAGAAIVGPAAGVIATTAAAAAAGAVGGAVGSAVSQGILIAGGVQEEFSWTEVGIGALTGFIGGGLLGGAAAVGNAARAGAMGARAAALAARAATAGRAGQTAIVAAKAAGHASVAVINEAVSQGVRIAAGDQEKFNWSYVASAAVMGAFSGAASSLGKSGSLRAVGYSTFGDTAGAALGNVIVNNGGFDSTQFLADAAGSLAGGALSLKSAQFGRQWAKDRAETRARSNAVTEAPHKRRINAVTRFGDNVDGAVQNLTSKVGHIEIPHSKIAENSGADSRLVVVGHGGKNSKGEFTVGGKTAEQMADALAAGGAKEFARISLAACDAGDSNFPNKLYKALEDRGVKVGSITARQSEVRVAANGQKFTQGAGDEIIHKGAKMLITSGEASDNQLVERGGRLVSQAELDGVSDPLVSFTASWSSQEAHYQSATVGSKRLDGDAEWGAILRFTRKVSPEFKSSHTVNEVLSEAANQKRVSYKDWKGSQSDGTSQEAQHLVSSSYATKVLKWTYSQINSEDNFKMLLAGRGGKGARTSDAYNQSKIERHWLASWFSSAGQPARGYKHIGKGVAHPSYDKVMIGFVSDYYKEKGLTIGAPISDFDASNIKNQLRNWHKKGDRRSDLSIDEVAKSNPPQMSTKGWWPFS
ncbi:MAG: LysM peptidoglycan-binding domain-containing protein [Gammaproteobacteria bacterium]|nr:LysM peptidoglycan-binding domain-containing protein [Gammaproteobacteria bacterium]